MAKTKQHRFQLGEFYLEYRANRQVWCVCRYQPETGTRSRVSTGIGGGDSDNPPLAAQTALAEAFANRSRVVPEGGLSPVAVLGQWFEKVGSKAVRAHASGYSIKRWLSYFATLPEPLVDRTTTQGFIDLRLSQGVCGETIHSERATLAAAMKWGVEHELMPTMPVIARVEKKLRSGPKELEFSVEEVGRIITAAARRPDRINVLRFILISLSTHGRTQAIHELTSEQIKNGVISFNVAGRQQTDKRRSRVPVAPTLAPWLTGIEGPILTSGNVIRSFKSCVAEAGLTEGSPNTLRHTLHTYLQTVGVPQAQIDTAAGHSNESGSGKNYTHLRPEYLQEFIAAIEAYWTLMDKHTTGHRHPNLVPIRSHALEEGSGNGTKSLKNMVEPSGLEPLTSTLPVLRSTN